MLYVYDKEGKLAHLCKMFLTYLSKELFFPTPKLECDYKIWCFK